MRTADVLSADQRTTEGPQFGEGTVSGGHQTQNPTPQMAVTMGFWRFVTRLLHHASKVWSTQRNQTEQSRSVFNDRRVIQTILSTDTHPKQHQRQNRIETLTN